MRRRFFTLLSMLSLVLCLATCVLWVRSYWVTECWQAVRFSDNDDGHTIVKSQYFLGVFRGILFTREREVFGRRIDYSPNADLRRMDHPGYTELSGIDNAHTASVWTWPKFFLGCAFQCDHSSYLEGQIKEDRVIIAANYWLLATLFVLPPAIWMLRKRREYGNGRCRSCGYDLRATPDRCPECGKLSKEL